MKPPLPSVNYHLWEPCNMRCRFCFATFQDVKSDVLPKGHLEKEEAIQVVQLLAKAGFEKITFAGGEPLLCPWLLSLIKTAKELGLTTMVVTNGSKLSSKWLDQAQNYLNWIVLSIDSVDEFILKELGRSINGQPLGWDYYLQISHEIKSHNIRLKLNTVVTSLNWCEDMTDFVYAIKPERWKILQVLPIQGQNDGRVELLLITETMFAEFVNRHIRVKDSEIEVIPETNELMTGSYIMVDPAGRFFDNTSGKHFYSDSILTVGVTKALEQVQIYSDRFEKRGGRYLWK